MVGPNHKRLSDSFHCEVKQLTRAGGNSCDAANGFDPCAVNNIIAVELIESGV